MDGPAGAGKTTVGFHRLRHLLDSGVWARSILVVTPQRTLATPYQTAIRQPDSDNKGQVTISTVGGLARRMVDLFWPMVAQEAGFAHPNQPPTFLTLETAQYYMARLVQPLLEQGYFETVAIDRNRLYSQILDNLNKAAVVGFPFTEIDQRLNAAWNGDRVRPESYQHAQGCVARFREYCLNHNLLDFSLQIEVFVQHLWTLPLCRDYLLKSYNYVIADNVEEDTPVAHDLLKEWVPHCQSALVIYDLEAGYRRFLGADPDGALDLKGTCQVLATLDQSFVTSPQIQSFGAHLAHSLNSGRIPSLVNLDSVLAFEYKRYHPEMLDWVANHISRLVHEEAAPPCEIVVLAPFVSDALRFALNTRLERHQIPVRSHRPSRALRDEPVQVAC